MTKEANTNKKEQILQWVIFGAYAALLIIVSCFHEPWHDEAEAWQMAKAPLKDILFYIPHYEGHPALWYLILSIPAKLGVPYELGLKSIACAAALVYGWLILFRSPFPKILRFVLPFHYFLIYQYGVLSRPYCLMVLCLFLMAMAFRKRNEKPFRFLLPMAVLCALSGYGVVIAGGICLAWVWEILCEKGWKFWTLSFWKDRRILGLFLLLVVAVAVILEIMPRPDTYATTRGAGNSLIVRLLYTMFMMLPDSTVITVLEGAAYLNKAMIAVPIIIVGVVIGICMLFAIACFGAKKDLKYFFVPYVLFTVFAACVYLCAHHMGLILVFTIFWLWLAWENPERGWLFGKLKGKMKVAESDARTLGIAGRIALAVVLIIPLYWTAGASFLDVTQPFYYSRDLAKFLKNTGLSELKIMGGFEERIPLPFPEGGDFYDYVNTELVARPVTVTAYFDRNICENLNMGRDDAAYALHRVPSAEENRKNIEAWRAMGAPDVIINDEGMFLVLGDDALGNYVAVYEYAPFMHIWKAFTSKYNIQYKGYVFLRKDLLDKYGLKPIQ